MAKKILKIIAIILGVFVAAFALLLVFLSVTEYKPKDREAVEVVVPVDPAAQDGEQADASSASEPVLSKGDSLSLISWNIGYGALGDNADFFMDGGKSVNTATEDRLQQNLSGIALYLQAQSPDVLFLQEIDRDSARSHHVNEYSALLSLLNADRAVRQAGLAIPGQEAGEKGVSLYQASFANNFLVKFLPYPIPPIGKVDSGLAIFSSYPVREAERIQLPIPFSWPVRMANLKRCLLVNRVPVETPDGEKELVLVDLHLEAYDDGEGKAAQTQMLQSFLQEEADKGNYVIAGGDFNQIFDDVESPFPVYDGKWQPGVIDVTSFGDDFVSRMDDKTASCRSLDQPLAGADQSNFQFYIIDGFIVSSNVKIDELKTENLEFVWSDHNPVQMKVTLE